MIIFKNQQFAETDNELQESLFTSGASLHPLHKIQKTKNSFLFFIDCDLTRGFIINRRGVFGQFSTLSNGERYYQYYLEKDENEKQNHKQAIQKYLELLK